MSIRNRVHSGSFPFGIALIRDGVFRAIVRIPLRMIPGVEGLTPEQITNVELVKMRHGDRH